MNYKSNHTAASSELFTTSTSSKKAAPTSSSAASSSSTSGWSNPSSSSYNYGNSSKSTLAAPSSFLSEAQKSKKIAEAAEWREKAKKSMKSSFWSKPDTLSAFSYYKKAAECYRSLGDPEKEASMRQSAGECSMTEGQYASSAGEYRLVFSCRPVSPGGIASPQITAFSSFTHAFLFCLYFYFGVQ